MKKYAVEAIGTFFLVLTIGLCVLEPTAGPFAPLAIAAVLLGMIYAGVHISGAHYNPAVTLAVWMRGRCEATDIPGYIAAQLVGSALAAGVALYLKGFPEVTAMTPDVGPALLAEFLFTFALVWVILNTATAKGTEGNSFYGAAIAFTVLAGVYAVGDVSGAAFNPAVAVGITILGLSSIQNIWIFLVANFLGAAAAALASVTVRRSLLSIGSTQCSGAKSSAESSWW